MELTEENVNKVIDFMSPFAVANGGSIQFIELESETKTIKVKISKTGDMTIERMMELIEENLKHEMPDCLEVVQVL